MNLVDCKVLEVLSKKEVELNGEPWVSYRVKAIAWGHISVCTLSYKKHEDPVVTEGFIFQA